MLISGSPSEPISNSERAVNETNMMLGVQLAVVMAAAAITGVVVWWVLEDRDSPLPGLLATDVALLAVIGIARNGEVVFGLVILPGGPGIESPRLAAPPVDRLRRGTCPEACPARNQTWSAIKKRTEVEP